MLVRLGGILILAVLAVWLYCVLDVITADRDRVRRLPKGVWIAIVLLTFGIGAVAWLVAGRPRGPEPGRTPRLGSSKRTSWPERPGRGRDGDGGAFRRAGPLAPDDDPEFLARLERQAAADHEKLLGSWEADLRRREDELRRDEPDGGGAAEPRGSGGPTRPGAGPAGGPGTGTPAPGTPAPGKPGTSGNGPPNGGTGRSGGTGTEPGTGPSGGPGGTDRPGEPPVST